jgi:hypothetical protein
MFYRENLVKHYTPPTCTLEIYHKNFGLFNKNNSERIPANFNFKLHFDDPRLPEAKTITIEGDRPKLESLCQVVKKYINDFIKETKLNFPLTRLNEVNKSKQKPIYIINKGLLNQELYYKNLGEDNQAKIINLSSSQLFDLTNALENYQIDVQISAREPIKVFDNFSLFVISLIFLFFGGGITAFLWGDTFFSQEEKEDVSNNIARDNPLPIEDLIPPDPLNPTTIPSVPSPQIPEGLQNREQLPPPQPIIQPPNEQANNLGNPTIETPPLTTDINPVEIKPNLIPPPPKPPIPESSPSETISSPPPNLFVIQPLETSPTQENYSQPNESISPLGGSSFTTISPSPTREKVRVNLDKLPLLRANELHNSPDNLSNTSAAASTTNQPNQLTTEINPIQAEVQQYFQKKWQPPENLNRSLEYRLVVKDNGSLERIQPLSQASKVFIDRTGMPLLGETIASSSLPENEKVTIRLILSTDGKVQTFQE